MPGDRIELDLHRLELRFADSRLVEPRAVAQLAESIERCGQIVPCIVVAAPGSQDGEGGGAQALVLIDGYRRVGALRRLGRDTVGVEQWSCDLTTALLRLLARTRDRAFASIEEALLLRALVAEHGLSRHEVARRSGRDVSWVSRRLQLLSGLPDAALAAVRGGHLSSWVANRVIVPLARANSAHAERLLAMLAATPLSTRELQCWFEHYQQTLRTVREHMVNRPRHVAGEHGEARRRTPACRPRRRMHRRFALPRGGDRAAGQACRHAAPAAGAADRGGTAPAHGDRGPDQRA
jgi:ParB family chromosome partitioning protein